MHLVDHIKVFLKAANELFFGFSGTVHIRLNKLALLR